MGRKQILQLPELALGVSRGDLEEEGFSLGFKAVAGLDEVGRGPLAGPVMAAAVIFPRGFVHPDITDSKLLSHNQRESLVPLIKEKAQAWALGSADHTEIDRINILQASLLAMARALRQLELVADYLLIDGMHKIPSSYLLYPPAGDPSNSEETTVLTGGKDRLPQSLPCQRTVKQGDRASVSIAAASILAKVTRDRLMTEYDQQYPGYGFAGHKGYCSASHVRAIQKFGPSPIHRRSFRPVRDLLVPEGGVQQSTLYLKG